MPFGLSVNRFIGARSTGRSALAPGGAYAGTRAAGLFTSTDAGATWSASTTTNLSAADVYAVAIDPATSNVLYTGLGDAPAAASSKSTDGGVNWTDSGLTRTSAMALAIDPLTTTTLYAATSGGVFKSADAGMQWTASDMGLASLSANLNVLTIEPGVSRTVYAGTEGRRLEERGLRDELECGRCGRSGGFSAVYDG